MRRVPGITERPWSHNAQIWSSPVQWLLINAEFDCQSKARISLQYFARVFINNSNVSYVHDEHWVRRGFSHLSTCTIILLMMENKMPSVFGYPHRVTDTFQGKVITTIRRKLNSFSSMEKNRRVIATDVFFSPFFSMNDAIDIFMQRTHVLALVNWTDACNWWLQLRHTFADDPNNSRVFFSFFI